MKPINSKETGCDPVSSNCVIWQGPDIACIDLCKGDSITDVTFKLATELCSILDTLDIDAYDLSCFNLTACAPKDFKALIQFLIDRICALENITNTPTTPDVDGCPNCTVDIASCFQYTNQLGDTVTSMQLTDYVHAIGNKLCDLLVSLGISNRTLNNHNARITTLEMKPEPKIILPQITPSCVLPQVAAPIDVVLTALEVQFCSLRAATGDANNIYQSISKQPLGLSESKALGSNGVMGSIPGWINNVSNISDTLTNLWLTIADVRKAVQSILLNCCTSGCSDIIIDLVVVSIDSNTIKLYITGTIPSGFLQCNPSGTRFTIQDNLGGSTTIDIDLSTQINQSAGTLVSLSTTPVNPLSDITVFATPCFNNIETNTTCQNYVTYTMVNQSTCPVITITPSETSLFYSFVNLAGTASYTIELWNATNNAIVSIQTKNLIGPVTAEGTFSGLTQGTIYNIRVRITIGSNTTICPFNSTSTLPGSCPAPSNSEAVLTT